MKTNKLITTLFAAIMLIALLLPVGVVAESEMSTSISNAKVDYKIKEDGTIEITKIYVYAQRYTVEIPGEIDGRKVTSIGDRAARDEETSKKEYYITLPEGLESIGDYAFYNSYYAVGNGTRILGALPSTLKHIGDYAFERLGFKESVNIPDGLTEMSELAFYNTYVRAFTVGQNNPVFASIDGVLFRKEDRALLCYPQGLDDSTYTVPDGIQTITPYAFRGNDSLYTVVFSESIHRIGHHAFMECKKLHHVNIPGSVLEIDDGAFMNCNNIEELTLNNGLQRIGAMAFSSNRLREIEFPDTLTEIDDFAFSYTLLNKADITSNIQYIGKNPFYPVGSSLHFVVAEGNKNYTVYQNSLYERSTGRLIAVELGSWPNPSFESDYVFADGVSIIGAYAFNKISVAGNVHIPETVHTIEEGAFSSCRIDGELILPKGITEIADYLFHQASIGCLDIPEGVKSIGQKALCCSSEQLSLPASITEMADDAMSGGPGGKVIVPQNSYAEQYCIDHNITYIYPNSTDWLNP